MYPSSTLKKRQRAAALNRNPFVCVLLMSMANESPSERQYNIPNKTVGRYGWIGWFCSGLSGAYNGRRTPYRWLYDTFSLIGRGGRDTIISLHI